MTATAPRRTDRRQLQQLVAGLSEGIVLVDLDGTIVWANAAALVMHGVTSAAGLGGHAAGYRKRFTLTYRNRHALTTAQYPIKRALAAGPFEDVVVEVVPTAAPDTRWVHQISALILTDSDDEPDGVALLIEDVTERITAEERFERSFNANPAPALICRLADLRYLRVNQGFLDMTGYTREAIVEHTVYEIDVFAQSPERDDAIDKLQAGRTIGQRESTLALPDGNSKNVVVAGQPIEIADEPAMLFTFMDLEPRRAVEAALRQSEERFSRSFRLSPAPTLILTQDDYAAVDVNDSFSEVFGYIADDMIGQNAVDSGLLGDAAFRDRLETALAEGRTVRAWELRARTADSQIIDCLLSAERMIVDNRPCVLIVLQDISERKRTEAELLNAIEAVMRDTSWFSRTVIEKLANIRAPRATRQHQAELADLTTREQEVLTLICRGLADKQIANTLAVSLHTVRNHVATIYSKLDVHKRGAAIIWARERGLSGDSDTD